DSGGASPVAGSRPDPDPAVGIDRRVPRARDVLDDGRGPALLRRGQRGAREHDLGISLPSPVARGMDRLRTPRRDPAVVLVPGRRGTAVLAGQPAGPETVARQNDGACGLAIARTGLPRGLPPFDRPPSDQLHIRGYPLADWPGLHIPLLAGHAVGPRPVDRVRRHRGGLLGALRGLSGAPGFRLP